jgi:hypothetical protein
MLMIVVVAHRPAMGKAVLLRRQLSSLVPIAPAASRYYHDGAWRNIWRHKTNSR